MSIKGLPNKHLIISTVVAIVCAVWLIKQPSLSTADIKSTIILQALTIFFSFAIDPQSLKTALAKYSTDKVTDDNGDSLESLIPYFKIMFTGTIIVIVSYGLAIVLIDYENNRELLVLTVSLITVFLIWLAHNWLITNFHTNKSFKL